MRRLFPLALIAGCATVDDGRPASQRIADLAADAAAAPLAVVIETVAGPVLDQADRAAKRIGETRADRRRLKDARALCLADPERFAAACELAFPEFADDSLPAPGPAAAPDLSPAEPRPARSDEPAGLRDSLRRHEGFRATPYPDRNGLLHIGYGRNLGVTVEQAEAMLERDVADAVAKARRVVGADYWYGLPEACRAVVSELAYTMTEQSLRGFWGMIAALRRGDREAAARELLDSKWAREDVSEERSRALAYLMRYGE